MIFLLALLFPTNDICKALCIRDNYDDGIVSKRGCICLIKKENFDDFLHGLEAVPSSPARVIKVENAPPVFESEP